MATRVTVTKPFAEKGRSSCTLMGKSMHANVIINFRQKSELDALIQFVYILVDV